MLDEGGRPPGFRLVVFHQVAEHGDQSRHAGMVSGSDIPFCVANVKAAFRFTACQLAGMQQRCGVRFALVQGITGDNGGRAPAEIKRIHEWFREPGGFVSHHTPVEAALFDAVEDLTHARKQGGVLGDVCLVVVE